MAATFTAAQLNSWTEDLNPDTARNILDEAQADGKIRSKSGRVVTEPLGFYALRLGATGSHQYEGVQFGGDEDEDRKIRSAMWAVYRATEPPASAQRSTKTDGVNRRETKARTSSQPMTVQFRMPDSLDRGEALAIAAAKIDEWLSDFKDKQKVDAQRTMRSAMEQFKKLGFTEDMLATQFNIPVEAARRLLEGDVATDEATIVATDEAAEAANPDDDEE